MNLLNRLTCAECRYFIPEKQRCNHTDSKNIEVSADATCDLRQQIESRDLLIRQYDRMEANQ